MHRAFPTVVGVVLLASLAVCPPCPAQAPVPDEKPYEPTIAPASDEAELALKTIKVPEGLRARVFAAEPRLANPVAFDVDDRGRVFVAETFRLGAGVTDNRSHMNWLDADLAARTVEDRVAYYRKFLSAKEFADFGVEHERIRLIEDADGDGQADRSVVFADGFHDPADGLAAGVLARGGDVWFTCIPAVYRLRDADGDGKADVRTSLHRGYGVHTSFIGHDLHGLIFGPDGKLYFSVGDRGMNVSAGGRTIALPDTGAVLRCNPDGSELEVVASGLRNPQELAFDAYGNLFTGDNNSDSGDRARVVYVVEGGDSGWHIGYQYLESPRSRGAWNAEKLWYPHFDGQAAFLVPPLANLGDGPSGLVFNPGVSQWPDRYRDHFFLADFRGASGMSGVRSFAVTPKGASFEVVDAERPVWSVLATDVDFGPDGALYVLDWVDGWSKPNKGRIYAVGDPRRGDDPAVREVRALLAEGFAGRPEEELVRLLGHADLRVRQGAQFALADRGAASTAALARVARREKDTIPRLHAIWGLGQVGPKDPKAYDVLVGLLDDGDREVLSQAAKVLGDRRVLAAYEPLANLLTHAEPRARFFAAIALGKLGRREAFGPVAAMLRDNADRDPYLRHAGVMGLAGTGDPELLREAAADDSAAVRMGVLLALRRLGRPEVARFLDDAEPRVVVEAARAIYDVPIADALPRLAALTEKSDLPEPILLRALSARARLGRPEDARALVAFARRAGARDTARVEALDALADWAEPPGRDPFNGLWRPVPKRSAGPAAEALAGAIDDLLKDEAAGVPAAAARAAGRLAIREAAPGLIALIDDPGRSTEARVEALKALDALKDPRLTAAVKKAVDDRRAAVRTEAQRLLARLDPAEALPLLDRALAEGSTAERQGALAILGAMDGPAPDAVLSRWLDRLIAGEVAPEVQLDLIEAAGRRDASELKEKLRRYEQAKPTDDPLAAYREALAGGDARRGLRLFYSKAEVSCLRCHKVRRFNGEPVGGEVGPELTGIAARKDRQYLLESIVAPDRQIAEGFETVLVATADGQVRAGVLRGEDDKALHLIDADGKAFDVPKDEVEDRKRGPSAMPADLVTKLTKAELRDLVEFLAGLKTPPGLSSSSGHGVAR